MGANLIRLDDIDEKILNILRYNAKRSLKELSDELGIPISTVRYRIKRLEDAQVIRGYVALIDRVNLGLNVSLVMEIETVPYSIKKVAQDLGEFSEVVRIYGLDNGPRLHVHMIFKDDSSAHQFIANRLYNIKGIKTVSISRIIERYKIDPSVLL
ncbi:AsnC family transcriptional regulator [Sulfolobus sp. A20]|uniref:Lrp/AsnC family transcriptional regulator n=1 Tax=Saccharolobus sp. A20 TaxID=1891280 RepID=UPI000845E011|nr:Lrp/AsnC family transcriptional regulator [Sulfolobus sp. A20]TRM75653.1 Lrp/AsnC family transcriptional regulator [Sulfolobus sp. B5]TRM76299.1 Lrp/AsnC family transcriptional regulator [Sulfolobus sp. E5]TRM80792.1 Lrp/AsnC family transcriptional regulator [Sulfolobus sp. D5]TRM84026.1 Lrp/AsnC family transcriptional regulator [Sulfolobus sp. A20-N-F6]TRM84988.1 Lrp/AsnC family transcriptional regulator [Sulfolobus sp. F3]TRM88570.1 Lrp/AsnC family transcriptional regulator [Sulfolobus s